LVADVGARTEALAIACTADADAIKFAPEQPPIEAGDLDGVGLGVMTLRTAFARAERSVHIDWGPAAIHFAALVAATGPAAAASTIVLGSQFREAPPSLGDRRARRAHPIRLPG
jgi:hypothetical protein